MLLPRLLLLCVICLQLHHNVFAAKILGLFSAPLYSHQLIYQTVMKSLANRGHEVTVVSPNPLKLMEIINNQNDKAPLIKEYAGIITEPHNNYVDIDQSILYKFCQADLEKMNMNMPSPLEFVNIATEVNNVLGKLACEVQLKSSELQEFLESYNSTFDLVLIERLATVYLDGIAHHFGSPPKVGIVSFLVPTWVLDSVGNPHNPSYAPNFLVSYTDHKTFWERFMSVYFYFKVVYNWQYEVIPQQDKLFRNYFVTDPPPPISESDRNFSLYLYHGDWSVGYPVSLIPSVLGLRGIHVQKTPNPLQEHIQNFIDEAVEGVVFFSLGSNINTRNLPDTAAQMILDSLAKLPQRVLLKWDSTELNKNIENIMVAKWFPQQDILAHQNVKVFVTQCGIQSMQEAVYHAVPIVAIPFLQEQKLNSHKIVNEGAGVSLDISEITEEILIGAISTVIQEKSYKESMERLSAIIKDEPQPSLDQAIWWIEYILRNNGAKHLRPAVQDLIWPQYLLLDVLLTTLAVLLFSVFSVWSIICAIRKRLTRRF